MSESGPGREQADVDSGFENSAYGPASRVVVESGGLGGLYYSDAVSQRASDALRIALNKRNLNVRIEPLHDGITEDNS